MHHIAFATPDLQSQEEVRKGVLERGLNPTPVKDRNYFQSIYFREPGGVLFEVATTVPGFTVDEQPGQLGTALKLPAQFESQRSKLEATLPKVVVQPSDFT